MRYVNDALLLVKDKDINDIPTVKSRMIGEVGIIGGFGHCNNF